MSDRRKGFSPEDFGEVFQAFLEYMNQWASEEEAKDLVSTRVREFMGGDLWNTHVVSEGYPDRDLPNVHLALERFLAAPGRSATLLGFAVEHGYLGDFSLSALAANNSRRPLFGSGLMVGPVSYRNVNVGNGAHLQCIQWGLSLVQDGDARLIILIKGASGSVFRMRAGVVLEVMARTKAQAERLLDEIRGLVNAHNIYRGQLISIAEGEFGEDTRVTFAEIPTITRDEIVLPSELLARIERNTLGFARQVERLRAAKRHIRRGVLFHGPPGTGKTLTAMYLADQFKNERTVIMLNAQSLGLVHEAVTLARALTPAMVVMEDVDLVAEDRESQPAIGSLVVLHDLLNEMDGLGTDADILFLLTTNRPEVLEAALTSRPGRIDQAFEFSLPDYDARRRLFALYSQGLNVQFENPDHIYRRTAGASPAFIREALRKAALFASEETAGPALPTVTDRHIEEAISELVDVGGDLTKSLLGAERLDKRQWTLTGGQEGR